MLQSGIRKALQYRKDQVTEGILISSLPFGIPELQEVYVLKVGL